MLDGMNGTDRHIEAEAMWFICSIYNVFYLLYLPFFAYKINDSLLERCIDIQNTDHWTFNELPVSIINRLTIIIDYDFMLIMVSHEIKFVIWFLKCCYVFPFLLRRRLI